MLENESENDVRKNQSLIERLYKIVKEKSNETEPSQQNPTENIPVSTEESSVEQLPLSSTLQTVQSSQFPQTVATQTTVNLQSLFTKTPEPTDTIATQTPVSLATEAHVSIATQTPVSIATKSSATIATQTLKTKNFPTPKPAFITTTTKDPFFIGGLNVFDIFHVTTQKPIVTMATTTMQVAEDNFFGPLDLGVVDPNFEDPFDPFFQINNVLEKKDEGENFVPIVDDDGQVERIS